ncbi:Excreted virulence factor EspC, type VII ESX diderm [Amycolatopsis marina]|uniref:Excreted virulence factor EspC, type VII ESX diderm n=1 Tax=Amycolatopsis marina TaxID=490629 RepID=A0A1I0YVR6_9PSEU|nr:type VII secretion target [Amycolatopsis marina]SFB16338.1 Excreted virulence factor EspC, type VII ESX diderm [Amycolatopsis marina]
MSEGYEVEPERVRAHAETVRGFQDRAAKAAAAGTHLSGLDDAYGVLCQPFGAMLNEPQSRGTEALTKTADVTGSLAEGLTAAADAYEQLEERIEELMVQLERSVTDAGACVPTVEA